MRAWIGWSLKSLPGLMLWDSVIGVKTGHQWKETGNLVSVPNIRRAAMGRGCRLVLQESGGQKQDWREANVSPRMGRTSTAGAVQLKLAACEEHSSSQSWKSSSKGRWSSRSWNTGSQRKNICEFVPSII